MDSITTVRRAVAKGTGVALLPHPRNLSAPPVIAEQRRRSSFQYPMLHRQYFAIPSPDHYRANYMQ